MTDRDEMIEVIHESEIACDDAERLADRLIAACFGLFEKVDGVFIDPVGDVAYYPGFRNRQAYVRKE